MSRLYTIPLWKSSPFVRLLPPLICGIVLQWYVRFPFLLNLIALSVFLFCFTAFYFLKLGSRFHLQFLQGLFLNLVIFCSGIFLTYEDDISNDKNWFGYSYNDSSSIIVKLMEPPVEKERSFKAEARAEGLIINGFEKYFKGKLLIYFSKDDTGALPRYGDRILIHGGLQRIRNSGNPGSFDYERYMRFQQTFHQAFLKQKDYVLLGGHKENRVYSFIFFARSRIVAALKKFIKGDKKVTGITEALLIGYKEDLDKDTVQAYSNTGVVHIIAISGMHLGLIYVVLVWIFSRLPFIKRTPLLKVILILSCLWLFSLITGASASVIRSAVMFTCIIIGKTFFKQASIYNSLAASAFLLLCYDPFLLWDVGFQLSYFAVTGIVWLQRPIFNLLYTKHAALQKLWELCAISLAAQVLTLPVCLYYFHQLPTTFLITNIICVPLSTVIIFAEIAVLGFSFITALGSIAGKFTYILTWLMNAMINICNKLPFSLIDNICINPVQTIFLYAFTILFCHSLLHKNKLFFRYSLAALAGFTGFWSYEKVTSLRQKKIVFYNISRHTALDFIEGNKYLFYGDSMLTSTPSAENFYLKPTRVFLQADRGDKRLRSVSHQGFFWQFYGKKIMAIDSSVAFEPAAIKTPVDILLISCNPKLKIADVACAVSPALIVFDASNSVWKIGQWKKECEQLHLRCRNMAEEGAFVLECK